MVSDGMFWRVRLLLLMRLSPFPFLIFSLSACMTWQPIPIAEVDGSHADDRPSVVRVVTQSGEEVLLHQPLVVGDSLYGLAMGQQVSYATKDIQRAEAKKTDELRTAGAAYGGLMAVGVVVIFIWLALEAGGLFTAGSGR